MYLGGGWLTKLKYPGKDTKPPLPFSRNEILQSNDVINSDPNGE